MRLKKNRPYNHWLKSHGHYLLCYTVICDLLHRYVTCYTENCYTEIRHNNISCDSENDENCDWKTTTKNRSNRDRSELQLLCRYNSCKAVANNGEGWKTAFRKENKSLISPDSGIRRGLGIWTETVLHNF